MIDVSQLLWIVALLLLAAIVAAIVVCTVGLAAPAASRAQRLQRMSEADNAGDNLRQSAPAVMSPWRPAIGIFVSTALLVLAFIQSIRDRENQSRWIVMTLAAGGGLVWCIGLVHAAVRMAARIHSMYPGG